MMNREKTAVLVIGALTLVLLTAGASAYVTRNQMAEEPTRAAVVQKSEKISWNDQRREVAPEPQPQQVVKNCDDANIVGTALGAVAGGVAGSQIGSGKGQDLAIIGGAVGGGFLGNQYIPTRNVTCK